MSAIYKRIVGKVRRDGLADSMKTLYSQARSHIFFDETHFWFERELLAESPMPKREMPQGTRLVSAGMQDIALLEQIPAVSLTESVRRLGSGNQVWIAVKAGRPAFSCWTLYESVPVVAAPGGSLSLPPGVVMSEDAVALPGIRNQGLAFLTLQNVLSILQDEGYRSLITRTRHDNLPAQKLAAKLGFHKIASNHYRRSGLATYGFVFALDTPTANWIGEKLESPET